MAERGPARPLAGNSDEIVNWLYRSPMEWAELHSRRAARKPIPKPQAARPSYKPVDLDMRLDDGSTLRQNMKTVEGWVDPANYPSGQEGIYPYAFGQWLGSVLKKGQWGVRLGEPGVQYNYGVTAERLGIPLELAQRAAGLTEQLEPIFGFTGGSSKDNPAPGNIFSPLGRWPYGDHATPSEYIGSAYNASKADRSR